MSFERLKYSKVSWVVRRGKHALLDLFRKKRPELQFLKGRLHKKHYNLFGNGPSLNRHQLPVSNVIICNHFWRHPHYQKLRNGFHVVSDYNFVEAKDIHSFIEKQNDNLVFISTPKIISQLVTRGYKGTAIEINYSGSKPIWEKKFPLNDDFTETLQTGCTVVADIALPLVSYTNVTKLNIFGVDLDYGKDGKSYAFDVSQSKLADQFFMQSQWQKKASLSIERWIYFLNSNGVSINWKN